MLTPEEAGLTPLAIWKEAYEPRNAKQRLERIRGIAPRFKKQFTAGKPVIAVRTLPVSKAPYPTTYAFNRAHKTRFPFLLFQNRALLVQFWQNGEPKTLLMNPTIPERSATAPFFARLAGTMPFKEKITGFLVGKPVAEQITEFAVRPEDIDYVAFDHQHVQDLRPYLGTNATPSLYPNAKYLVQREDWEASIDLHPMQNSWWIAESANQVDTKNLVLLDGDVQLGDGCAVIATPGHTYGNQSLLFRAPVTGCYTVSENGICMDSYSPEASTISGLADHAKLTGEEVILNGNTLENALDQYNSMVKEKLLADVYAKDPRFVQHFSSSELIHSPIAPGLKATHAIVAVNEGALIKKGQLVRG
jgi:hypothetical protein